jgi:hypothetical protein
MAPLRRRHRAGLGRRRGVVIAAGELARRVSAKPIGSGIDHRLDPHHPGVRDLVTSRSTRLAGEGRGGRGGFDVAELHAPFAPQEPILREALGLDPARTRINPSGGALAAHATMVAGLARVGEAARQIQAGKAERALAHATQGPCLQQNLVCVLEAS